MLRIFWRIERKNRTDIKGDLRAFERKNRYERLEQKSWQ